MLLVCHCSTIFAQSLSVASAVRTFSFSVLYVYSVGVAWLTLSTFSVLQMISCCCRQKQTNKKEGLTSEEKSTWKRKCTLD